MRLLAAASLAVSTVLSGTAALADDKAACLQAASQGQTLRDAHKLVEAREQFQTCARQGCPAVVRRDCANWFDAVGADLPTVIVSAKDGAGKDLVDVRVVVDGRVLTTKLNGEAVPMNPGVHAFHWELADGTSADRQVPVTEGHTNQTVEAVLQSPSAPPPPETSAARSSSGSPGAWKVAGFVLGGVGIVGLAVGAVFGVMAVSDKGSAHCDANGYCDPGPLADARSAATVSTIAVAIGGGLLATGVALVLFAPERRTGGVSIRATPTVGTRQSGLRLEMTW